MSLEKCPGQQGFVGCSHFLSHTGIVLPTHLLSARSCLLHFCARNTAMAHSSHLYSIIQISLLDYEPIWFFSLWGQGRGHCSEKQTREGNDDIRSSLFFSWRTQNAVVYKVYNQIVNFFPLPKLTNVLNCSFWVLTTKKNVLEHNIWCENFAQFYILLLILVLLPCLYHTWEHFLSWQAVIRISSWGEETCAEFLKFPYFHPNWFSTIPK